MKTCTCGRTHNNPDERCTHCHLMIAFGDYATHNIQASKDFVKNMPREEYGQVKNEFFNSR